MTYELAMELKQSGFPYDGFPTKYKEGDHYEYVYNEDKTAACRIPTLEELALEYIKLKKQYDL